TPGVTMAAISSNATPPRNGWDSRFEILGQPAAEQQKASVNLISPAYFGILRIPLVAGRIWDDAENRNGARVAVINQTLAKRYFPNGGAIGRSVKLPQLEEDSPGSLSSPKVADSWLQVVWIVNGQEWQQQRLAAWLFGAFSGLALALAAIGLYSVVSYTATQRTNEFGVRMALGAQRGHVIRMVFATTLRSVGSGICIGLAL